MQTLKILPIVIQQYPFIPPKILNRKLEQANKFINSMLQILLCIKEQAKHIEWYLLLFLKFSLLNNGQNKVQHFHLYYDIFSNK